MTYLESLRSELSKRAGWWGNLAPVQFLNNSPYGHIIGALGGMALAPTVAKPINNLVNSMNPNSAREQGANAAASAVTQQRRRY